MNILSAEQIRRADQFTIENEPISSIGLMERAAEKCFNWFERNVEKRFPIYIFCGPGNNGGDGLALARMLYESGYEVKTQLLQFKSTLSNDCRTNLEKLQNIDPKLVDVVISDSDFPTLPKDSIIVDAIFGTGLSRKIEKEIGDFISQINAGSYPIISIDLPSGIYSDESIIGSDNEIIKATKTLTFQYPKLAQLVAENACYFGSTEVLDIGLNKDAIPKAEVRNFLVDTDLIKSIYVPKKEFSNKGTFGHALLIAGERGKMGAAILSAGGFLRSGGGLLSILVPEDGIKIVQVAVPEAIVATKNIKDSEGFLPEMDKYSVVGAGPGIGTDDAVKQRLKKLIETVKKPMVLDADALNLLANHPEWYNSLPQGTILTPHPGEFKRLAGEWNNDFEKLEKQRAFAQKHAIYLILKGKNTSIACPDGILYFNPTGNAGMAKGGSGDVLTGLLTGLLASGYPSRETCILGVWLHGLAGDLAAEKLTQEGMKAGDLIDFLPEAWKVIAKKN